MIEVIKSVIAEYPTPFFLFSADELRDRAMKIKNLLRNEGRDIALCYSIKANPFLIPMLKDMVDKYEVCSPGELSICKHYGIEPEMVIYSGVHKDEDDIRETVSYGAAILTAESIRHYEYISSVAKELGRKTRIILRLSSGNQFGMSLDDIEYIIRKNKDNEYIKIEGLHYFAGTQRRKLKHQKDELMMLKEVFHKIRSKYDTKLKILEYGPGLSFPYFINEDRSDTLIPLKNLTDDLNAVADYCDLTIEMGRFLASSCGYYITKICDIKESDCCIWYILDGGINHLNYPGQMLGMNTPVAMFFDSNGNIIPEAFRRTQKNQTLCGSLCTSNDVILRNYCGSKLDIGYTLAFCNTGAYTITEGLYLFLSRKMPSVFVYNDGKINKIRDAVETWNLNS